MLGEITGGLASLVSARIGRQTVKTRDQDMRVLEREETGGHMVEGLATFRTAVRDRLNKLHIEAMSYGVLVVS